MRSSNVNRKSISTVKNKYQTVWTRIKILWMKSNKSGTPYKYNLTHRNKLYSKSLKSNIFNNSNKFSMSNLKYKLNSKNPFNLSNIPHKLKLIIKFSLKEPPVYKRKNHKLTPNPDFLKHNQLTKDYQPPKFSSKPYHLQVQLSSFNLIHLNFL